MEEKAFRHNATERRQLKKSFVIHRGFTPFSLNYRRARRLVHECCNYDGGNCIALDDGEECICVQSISYSLLCRWFRAAVLPLDRELETALFHRLDAKRCAVCGALFTPGSNRAKYCPECAPKVHRRQKAECERRRRVQRGQLEGKNPL